MKLQQVLEERRLVPCLMLLRCWRNLTLVSVTQPLGTIGFSQCPFAYVAVSKNLWRMALGENLSYLQMS